MAQQNRPGAQPAAIQKAKQARNAADSIAAQDKSPLIDGDEAQLVRKHIKEKTLPSLKHHNAYHDSIRAATAEYGTTDPLDPFVDSRFAPMLAETFEGYNLFYRQMHDKLGQAAELEDDGDVVRETLSICSQMLELASTEEAIAAATHRVQKPLDTYAVGAKVEPDAHKAHAAAVRQLVAPLRLLAEEAGLAIARHRRAAAS